jgi:hypothetical protein
MANSTKVKGYKIDFITNTVIVNYKFAEAAEGYGSPEYKLLQAIKNDMPDITVSVKSGREQKTARYNKRLTYANMEKYIRCFDNSDVLLERFETVKKMSATLKSPYKFVCDWFVAQFPDYKEMPEFEDNLTVVKFVPYPDKNKYQEKTAG